VSKLADWVARHVTLIGVLFVASLTSHYLARDPGRVGLARDVVILDSAPDDAKSFVAHLRGVDADVDPSQNMRLIECVDLPPTKILERHLAWSFVFQYFDAALPKRFPELTIELCRKIGGGSRTLQSVRSRGEGTFFVEGELLYFSTSDNSDPRFNGRRYRLEISDRAPRLVTLGTLALSLGLGILLIVHIVARTAGLYTRLFRTSALFRNTAPGILISLAAVCVMYAAAEVYLRCTVPFIAPTWPWHFDPRVGFLFDANATLKYTNGADFWTSTRVNSLGFLDREPKIPKPPGTFRILVIGDSFVEAAQVQVEQKFHVLLEKNLNERLANGMPIDTVALGSSGTGQVNQLAFYDAFGPRLKPGLVILLFVFNDFANNSSLLEAVRNGWSPLRPPRLFFRRAGEDGFERIGLAPDWNQYLLPVPQGQPYDQLIANRVAYLRHQPEFEPMLGDWTPPDDLDLDNMFYASEMPLAFKEALEATAEAFRVFAEYAKRDGFSLLVVATPHEGPSNYFARQAVPLLAQKRLHEVVEALGIPFFDLSPGFRTRGDPQDAVFRLDSHWSATGHRWAAEEIADYLVAHPALIGR
jgi:hypothetical protein